MRCYSRFDLRWHRFHVTIEMSVGFHCLDERLDEFSVFRKLHHAHVRGIRQLVAVSQRLTSARREDSEPEPDGAEVPFVYRSLART